jgi:hypothetical protein
MCSHVVGLDLMCSRVVGLDYLEAAGLDKYSIIKTAELPDKARRICGTH